MINCECTVETPSVTVQSQTPDMRDIKNEKICHKHNKSNSKLKRNTPIIKLQTFTSNIKEKAFENCFYLLSTVVYSTRRSD